MQVADINPLTLPSVPLGQRSHLPSIAAVYFLINKQNIIRYIGATTKLKNRWYRHHLATHCSETDRITYFEVDVAQLNALEKQLICEYRPELNKVNQTSFWGQKDHSRKILLPDGFGWQIRVIRRAKGFKLISVAAWARLSESQLSAIERGTVNQISTWKLSKIEEALGVDLGVNFDV